MEKNKNNLYRNGLNRKIAEVNGMPLRHINEVVGLYLDSIIDSLVDAGHITLVKFGSFEVVHRKGRKITSPCTGTHHVKPRNAVKFRPSKDLKKAVLRKEGDL